MRSDNFIDEARDIGVLLSGGFRILLGDTYSVIDVFNNLLAHGFYVILLDVVAQHLVDLFSLRSGCILLVLYFSHAGGILQVQVLRLGTLGEVDSFKLGLLAVNLVTSGFVELDHLREID